MTGRHRGDGALMVALTAWAVMLACVIWALFILGASS